MRRLTLRPTDVRQHSELNWFFTSEGRSGGGDPKRGVFTLCPLLNTRLDFRHETLPVLNLTILQ